MGRDYLLHSKTALDIYEAVRDEPIFDYHNHLPPQEICERRRYENLTQVWLGQNGYGDHYKWRAMRACGVEERYITGDATDWEKFAAWAQVVPKLPGNQLYDWTHLELKRYFGMDLALCPSTAREIWETANGLLAQEGFDAVGLLKQRRVKILCTTDDPFDPLTYHLRMQKESVGVQVLPTFRPDKMLHVEQAAFPDAARRMSERFGVTIRSFDDVCAAMAQAVAHFKTAGCLLSDHSLAPFGYTREGNPEISLRKALAGETVTREEADAYKSALMRFLAGQYADNGMRVQIHLGALRNANSARFKVCGPDFGYDSIGYATDPYLIAAMLDDFNSAGHLPNTVLYCLNPADFPVLSTLAADFSDARTKVLLGAAWWFNDTARGIGRVIDELMDTGMLSGFVGMLTDSRSFTSFTRHEFFRRILCDRLGALIEDGVYPNDVETMTGLARGICFQNAVDFFGARI